MKLNNRGGRRMNQPVAGANGNLQMDELGDGLSDKGGRVNAGNSMSMRVATRAGFDPTIIAAIIGAIIAAIQLCKKPATQSDVDGLLQDVAENHPDKCPLWLRGSFRQNGVRKLDDIHELWSVIADDAVHHSSEVATLMGVAA